METLSECLYGHKNEMVIYYIVRVVVYSLEIALSVFNISWKAQPRNGWPPKLTKLADKDINDVKHDHFIRRRPHRVENNVVLRICISLPPYANTMERKYVLDLKSKKSNHKLLLYLFRLSKPIGYPSYVNCSKLRGSTNDGWGSADG